MTDLQDPSFEFITAMQNAKARAEDLDRYNDALADRETGFGNRHERSDKRDARLSGKRMHSGLTALDLMLQDDTYADVYQRFGERLSELETATDDALIIAQRLLDQVMERAVQLPGVGPVFRSADGRVFDANGNEIEPERANGIIWPDGAPSYEEYRRQKRSVEALETYRTDVLGGYRDRLEDEDNPTTADELELSMADMEQRMPAAVSALAQTPVEGSPSVEKISNDLDVPSF